MRSWMTMLIAAVLVAPALIGSAVAEPAVCAKAIDRAACEQRSDCQWHTEGDGYCGDRQGEASDPLYKAIVDKYILIVGQFDACGMDFDDQVLDRALGAEIRRIYPGSSAEDIKAATDLAAIIVLGSTFEASPAELGIKATKSICRAHGQKYRQLR